MTGHNLHSVRHGGPQLDTSKAQRTNLPPFPCRRCNARGLCGHDDRTPDVWSIAA
jgi:hypothetical protein